MSQNQMKVESQKEEFYENNSSQVDNPYQNNLELHGLPSANLNQPSQNLGYNTSVMPNPSSQNQAFYADTFPNQPSQNHGSNPTTNPINSSHSQGYNTYEYPNQPSYNQGLHQTANPRPSLQNQSINSADRPVSSLSDREFMQRMMDLLKANNQELRTEFNGRIDTVVSKLDHTDSKVANLEDELEAVKSLIKSLEERVGQGNQRKGNDNVLHLRGWRMVNGQPWNPEQGSLPAEFFSMVEDIEHVSGEDFINYSRQGYTYYQIGWLIANNFALFRERCPALSVRSKTEIGKNIAESESRFFRDKRTKADVMKGRTKVKVQDFN